MNFLESVRVLGHSIPISNDATNSPNGSLQVTDARLHCVSSDDILYLLFTKADLVRADSILTRLPRKQVLFGDLYLFSHAVTVNVDDLHSIKQGWMDAVQAVRCRDEHDLAQIIRRCQEVISELVVLSWVQDFEKRGTRVSSSVLTHLVDLVKQNHRVA